MGSVFRLYFVLDNVGWDPLRFLCLILIPLTITVQVVGNDVLFSKQQNSWFMQLNHSEDDRKIENV